MLTGNYHNWRGCGLAHLYRSNHFLFEYLNKAPIQLFEVFLSSCVVSCKVSFWQIINFFVVWSKSEGPAPNPNQLELTPATGIYLTILPLTTWQANKEGKKHFRSVVYKLLNVDPPIPEIRLLTRKTNSIPNQLPLVTRDIMDTNIVCYTAIFSVVTQCPPPPPPSHSPNQLELTPATGIYLIILPFKNNMTGKQGGEKHTLEVLSTNC